MRLRSRSNFSDAQRTRRAWWSAAALGLLCVSGCVSTESRETPPAAPVALPKINRDSVGIADLKFSRLIGFENDRELVFLTSAAGNRIDAQSPGFGRASLRVETKSVTVRAGAMLRGRMMPGGWNLIGLQIRSAEAQQVVITLRSGTSELEKRTVNVSANEWQWLWTPAEKISPANQENLQLVVNTTSSPVWIDSVSLGENLRNFGETAGERSLFLELRGLNWSINTPSRFKLQLPTSQFGPDGLRRESSNAWRAVLRRADESKVYIESRGRMYDRGRLTVLDPSQDAAALQSSHANPGTLEILDESARVDRTSAGDRNNDGYNELEGLYRVATQGPRVQLALTPDAGKPIVGPMLRFDNMPAGEVQVYVEGKLIDASYRQPDTSVLVELPMTLQRRTTVEVRVRPTIPGVSGR
jgi:hypothetical protein